MNKMVLFFAAVIFLAVSNSCMAVNPKLARGLSISKVGFYAGVQAGMAGMNTPDFPSDVKSKVEVLGGSYSVKNKWGFAGRLFAGYLWRTCRFQYGLELGGMFYPNNKYNLVVDLPVPVDVLHIDMKYSGYLIDFLGVVKYYITPALNIFAKEGVAYTHQKLVTTVVDDPSTLIPITETTTNRDNKFLPEVAVGIGYNFISRAELSLTYKHVFGNELSMDGDNARSKVASVDGLLLGLTWKFS